MSVSQTRALTTPNPDRGTARKWNWRGGFSGVTRHAGARGGYLGNLVEAVQPRSRAKAGQGMRNEVGNTNIPAY